MKLTSLKKKSKISPVLRVWRSLPPPVVKARAGVEPPTIVQARGNPDARILLIAPPCSPHEYEQGLPLTDDAALVFHSILEGEAVVDTNTDCFVISASRFGVKPNKQSTEPIREFLEEVVKLKHFKLFVCVGSEAFKHTFGRGKKPTMATLAGNLMYVPETDHIPLFVFPDLEGLHVDMDAFPSRREAMRALDWKEKTELKFADICRRFKKAAKPLGVI